MKQRLYTLLLWSMAILFNSCEKQEDTQPCLEAEVLEQASCNAGFLLRVSAAAGAQEFCGTGLDKVVAVDNLPEHLQMAGTRFTCRLKERETKPQPCLAIYHTYYEMASLESICNVIENVSVN